MLITQLHVTLVTITKMATVTYRPNVPDPELPKWFRPALATMASSCYAEQHVICGPAWTLQSVCYSSQLQQSVQHTVSEEQSVNSYTLSQCQTRPIFCQFSQSHEAWIITLIKISDLNRSRMECVQEEKLSIWQSMETKVPITLRAELLVLTAGPQCMLAGGHKCREMSDTSSVSLFKTWGFPTVWWLVPHMQSWLF